MRSPPGCSLVDELVSYVFVDAVADEGAGSCAGEDPLVFQTVLGGKVLGDDLAGCAAGDVAGADEDSFEGAVAARAAGTVEGFGGELEQRGALASGVSSGGGLYVSCALVVGFFGVGELFGIDRGRVVVAHADDAGAGGLPSTSRMSPGVASMLVWVRGCAETVAVPSALSSSSGVTSWLATSAGERTS